MPAPADIRLFLLEELAEGLADAGLEPAAVGDDFDLLESGLLDSFGLLEILTAVEERFGFEVDFEALDPDELTRVGPLCHFVAAQS
jgi:acyl carrier protein